MASKVSVIMGSASDLSVVKACTDMLKEFGISFELKVLSAHRTPKELEKYTRSAEGRGIKLFIAAAGGSAALAGVIASFTTLPVIGIPIPTKALKGLDSLLSTVQMPKGVPVASMAIGEAGAGNAGILAAQILGLSDKKIKQKLTRHKKNMAAKVLKIKVRL
ncbi:MAG: 5-(carboxyamino)imidazole ribonucleotide mutase [Candidatus Omnitrophica bacterium]|nr:5-(carboxyamino)imidazole ribonucleotide mutase [Candidatus Omnitrophota bacterium]